MKNFRLDYVYDGYKFWDVVRASDEKTAREYFEHETNEGDAKVLSIAETTENPSYTAPDGYKYVKPEFKPLTDEERAEWERKSAKRLETLFA